MTPGKTSWPKTPCFAANVPLYYSDTEGVRCTLDYRDAMQRVFDRYPDHIELATSARQIEKIVASKKIAAVLTVEGGHQIADDIKSSDWRAAGFPACFPSHTT